MTDAGSRGTDLPDDLETLSNPTITGWFVSYLQRRTYPDIICRTLLPAPEQAHVAGRGRAVARKRTRRWSVGRRLMWSPLVDDALPRAGPLSRDMNPPRCVRPRPVTGRPSISSPTRPDSPPDEPDSKLAVEWTVGKGPNGEQ